MQPVEVDITRVKANDANPRSIKGERFEKLCQSLKEFPEMMRLRPIVVDADGTALGGNMRLRAAQRLGWAKVWVVYADQLTEEQKKRFIIADNVGFGEWDWDVLANEWDSADLEAWGLEMPGFESETPTATEDDYEMPDEVSTDIKTGDLIEIGPHRLMCGDSTDSGAVGVLMDGKKADIVFTDPPYGVAIAAKNEMLNRLNNSKANTTAIKDDHLSPEALKARLLPAFKNLKLVMNDCCSVFVTAPQGGDLSMMMMMMMQEAGLTPRHVLIWRKNSPTFSMGRLDYDYQHEPILFTWNKSHKFYGGGDHKTSVWDIPRPSKSKEHPTMKPVELVANALLNNSKVGDLAVDWYCGSGTTMVAAHQLERRCHGMEIEPKYCQVIVDRMLKLDPSLEVKINGTPYQHG
jgi:DNA modification methylase